ncbi:MAG: biotin/lipoate A/B protein ligase family protein [Candidatus Bathyarchaeia archaeon]
MRTWRLLDTGCRSAAENMALDDVILECRSRNLTPDTVRFLQFDPPAVLIGYHQVVEHEVRVDYCKSKSIDINRRITGGGAIYFENKSLGWEIFASKSEFESYRRLEELYEKMCEGVIFGLKTLGIQASFRPKNDIEVEGRKISGTGGTERGDAFLFQGTLLVDFDVDTMLRALRIPIAKLKDKEIRSVKERVTCMKWELGQQPSLTSVKEALKTGFEQAFGIKLIRGELTSDEQTLLRDRLDEFRSDKWVFLERRPLEEAVEVHAIDKTSGGLIRVSLAIDKEAKVIKSALITGDFFAYPSRAILDLEASLKYTCLNENEIRQTVYRFFETSGARVLGVTSEDLVQLILEAVGKMEYEQFGISPAEANHLYAILKNGTALLKNGFDFLLLPYCAKPLTCEYRRREGCTMCGECSVGTAYELALASGLKPVTIQNFEHLMETLEELRQANAKGYIGCCCEAFICKHQNDLKEAGIPALLLDINHQTCYDLGKEEEALKGNFESQTELKIDLLSKLVRRNGVETRLDR